MLLLTSALGAKAEKEMYTVLSSDGTTLTYYADDDPYSKEGSRHEAGYHNWSITKVVFDESFAEARPTSTNKWFYGMSSLQEIVGMENLNTSKVTSMSFMFDDCNSLTNLDVSHFDTSNVTDMSYMFYWCKELTSLDLSHFDTSKVTTMEHMFGFCANLTSIDISSFVTSNVTKMNGMFEYCRRSTNLEMSKFDTSNVIDMSEMFKNCEALTTLSVSHFNTSKVTNFNGMFAKCKGLTSIDVSNFDTKNATDIGYLFDGCSSLTSLDLSNFDTRKVNNMGGIFKDCGGITSIDVSHFDTKNASNMGSMFEGCVGLTNIDISKFETGNVTDMSNMFSGCTGLTSIDVSKFDTKKVTNMYGMFMNCKGLSSIDVSNFDTSNVTDMGAMFSLCSNLKSLDVTNFNTSNVTNMSGSEDYNIGTGMFFSCSGLTSLDVSHFDTSKVTKMGGMFAYCSGLTSLDVSNFNTQNVTNMRGMFDSCKKLSILELSNFDTKNVTNMSDMFRGCEQLRILDIYNFTVDNINVSNSYTNDGICFMFGDCNNLSTIFCKNYWTQNETIGDGQTQYLFWGCNRLVGGEGTAITIHQMGDFVYCCPDTPEATGYFTLKNTDLAYSIYDETAQSLSFYFDSQMLEHKGKVTRIATRGEDNYNIPGWYDYRTNITKIVFDPSFSNVKPISNSRWFNGCESLETIEGLENLNTQNVTKMDYMFNKCSKLTSLDLSHFDTSNVKIMDYMFYSCSLLKTIYVSEGWNVIDDCSTTRMFTNCTKLVGGMGTTYNYNYQDGTRAHIDGGSANPGYLTDIADLYAVKPYVVAKLIDDVATITYYYDDQHSMRDGSVLMLNNWNYSMATQTRKRVQRVVFDESFAEARPTSTSGWFLNMTSLQEIVGMEYLNTSNVTDMRDMFSFCKSLTSINLSHFDTSNVNNMYYMFNECEKLTSLDVSHFNTSNVTNFACMFVRCSSLTSLDLSNFDISKAERTSQLLRSCSALTLLSVSPTMTALEWNACNGVGSEESPCLLIAPEGFDYGVDTTGDYFQWRSGYFKLEDYGPETIAELTLDENSENEIPEGGTVVQTVNTVRTLVGGVWNTFCLPFSVTSDEMADENHPLHGAIIMTLTDVEYNDNAQMNLYFSPVVELTGGEPYVVKVPANVVNPTFHNVTITSQEPRISNVGPWQMAGIYSPYKFSQADSGIFFLTGGNKFSYVAEPGTMKGMRAYFVLKEDYDFANICINFDEATGITQLRVGESHQSEVYDLQGRKLNQTPAHGVYIINGKKYVK